MRTIDRSSAFKRDYKREAKGQHRATLDDALKPVLVAPATDQPLGACYRDHDLSGDWRGLARTASFSADASRRGGATGVPERSGRRGPLPMR